MIPIVSISHLITLPFLIFITFQLFLSFQGTKKKNVGYFFLVFLILLIMEGILASPGLVFKDPVKISRVFAFYPFFTFLSLGFAGALPFSILKMKKTEIIFLLLIFITAISITMINLSNVRPAVTYSRPPFIYWEDTRGEIMNIFIGIVGGIVLLFITFFFLINGLKSSERYVRIRSFLISAGMATFLLAAVVNFVLGVVFQQYITTLSSVFLLITGSILVFSGVRRKKEIQENSYSQENYPKIQW